MRIQALVALVAATAAPSPVRLHPLGASQVRAAAVVSEHGYGVRVTVTVAQAPPHARVRAVMNAGTCGSRSASFATAGSARADAAGRARWTAAIVFRGLPVDSAAVGNGPHVLVVLVGDEAAACGALPAQALSYQTARAAAATAPRCFSDATRLLSVQRRPLPPLPLPQHLERDQLLTRLYLVTYRLLEANAVDKPGRHEIFAYVARPNGHARWHLAACGTGP